MDIKSIEKRHKSKLVLIFAFEVFLLGIGFLTYSHMKDDPSFTFLSITNIKFLVPFAVALCGFGIKFKNYFLVKFPVILIIFMVLFLFSGKFSFLYSRNTIFFIRTLLFFGLLVFSLGVLLEWEIHIDIKSSIEYEENKIKLYYIINKIENNSCTLDDLCLLNNINFFFRDKIARINLYNTFYFWKSKETLSLLQENEKYFNDSENILKNYRETTSKFLI